MSDVAITGENVDQVADCVRNAVDWRQRALLTEAVVEAARKVEEAFTAGEKLRRLRSYENDAELKAQLLSLAMDEKPERLSALTTALAALDAHRSKR